MVPPTAVVAAVGPLDHRSTAATGWPFVGTAAVAAIEHSAWPSIFNT